MRILVMESINALPDRVLLVQEARRRALTEPAASTFSLTKRRCCSWHDGVDVISITSRLGREGWRLRTWLRDDTGP